MTIRLHPEVEAAVKQRVASGDADSVEAFVERAVRQALEADETAHLLSTAANAARLRGALARARQGEGESISPKELAERFGLDE